MPTHTLTITTTAAQEKSLTRLLNRTNAERAVLTRPQAPLPPFPDIPALLLYLMTSAVTDYVQQYKGEIRNAIGPALDNASGAQLANIATTLGVTLPT